MHVSTNGADVTDVTSSSAMDQLMVDADDSVGPLWIRRLVFEHSVAVPLLTATTASQIDFPRLAAELVTSSVVPPPAAPAVTYDAWVAAAGLHARLDSSEHAGIIIEALETNAPDAFVRCNEPATFSAGQQPPYRQLLVPVPELLAFIKLHAAATISSRFRQKADAVWPESEAAPLSPAPGQHSTPRNANNSPVQSPSHPHLAPLSLTPASPRLHTVTHSQTPQTPRASSSPPHGSQSSANAATPAPHQQPHQSPLAHPQSPSANNNQSLDSLVRKKTPPSHLGVMVNSQSAIIASAQYAFERETRLVVSNLKSLLLVIASSYGQGLDLPGHSDTVSPDTGALMGGTAIAVESGVISREDLLEKVRRAQSVNSLSSDTVMVDGNVKLTAKNLPVTRQMFEHLSFLLTTTCDPNGSHRPVSWVVPQWRDPSSTTTVQLGELTDILTDALARVPLSEDIQGATNVTEIRDLDRKTIVRSNIPSAGGSLNKAPPASEVRISNCHESHFYLLCSLGRVSFIGCRSCTLFIGACVSLSLISCENVRVHAIARVCRVTNSFDTHLYICTNRFSQIVGENRGLLFAPYNAAYPKDEVEKHLAAVGVDPHQNVWDKFYRPAYRVSSQDRKDPALTAAVASILQPEQFLPFAVPLKCFLSRSTFGLREGKQSDAVDVDKLETEGSIKTLFSVTLPLPQGYEEQLRYHCQEIAKLRKEIRAIERRLSNGSTAIQQSATPAEPSGSDRGKDVAMNETSENDATERTAGDEAVPSASSLRRGVVQSLVQERFREWLNHSGRVRQLGDLLRLEQET